MAKLSAHGRHELARFEYASKRIARMSDGVFLVDYGQGWKEYAKLKQGINPVESATVAKARYDARPAEFHAYIKALRDCVPLRYRGELHTCITMMPDDSDGVWSMMDDRIGSWGSPSFEDIQEACSAYLAVKSMG
jgi:hypothetical protein